MGEEGARGRRDCRPGTAARKTHPEKRGASGGMETKSDVIKPILLEISVNHA